MLKFIMIYGLPGCGKTTLCKELAKQVEGLNYIDLGGNADFKTKGIGELIVELFDKTKDNIVEGCFTDINARRSILRHFKATHEGTCIYLYEPTENLAKRRNRSEDDYWQLMKKTQVLYKPPTDIIMDLKTVQERVDFIKKLLVNG